MPDAMLSARFAQDSPFPLDVAFTCGPGQVLALFGPSGSGKTTILRGISGLSTPTAGRVTMGGETWLDTSTGRNVPPHLRQAGSVFQEYALFPHLTALGNVAAALGHRPRQARPGRARELLSLVHLEDRADRLPSSLSGGERQRVAVARALAREPRVLLLDEPFAAMDRSLRRVLHAEIDDIRRAFDIPIVLVTHDFEDVVRLATDLVILHAGRVVASGTVADLTSRPDMRWLGETVGLGAVMEATVTRLHQARGLAELTFDDVALLAPASGLVVGARVRIRIPAREVILATDAPLGLSIHNALPVTVSALGNAGGSDQVVVQLQVGHARLLAEVTRDAVSRLEIVEGRHLHALIKSVSLEVQPSGTF